MKARSFTFTSYHYEPEEHRVSFQYELLPESGQSRVFTERITLPPGELRSLPEPVLSQILMSLHLILGISYWKIYCPLEIAHPYSLTESQAVFWNTIYTIGLGEFYYKNQIDFSQFTLFTGQIAAGTPQRIAVKQRALVGIGGGKDSIVSAEILKKARYPFTGFVVQNAGQNVTLDEMIQKLQIGDIRIIRALDPQIREITDGYNGHIPISVVYAFLGIYAALLYDYSSVIVSNEESSNHGNVEYLGMVINHQWSKSGVFEELFQRYVHEHITPDITYFSLLRPFSELKITQFFTGFPQYFPSFSSCNRNFRMQNADRTHLNWCGECPKCAFAYVMLAAFLPKDTLFQIFAKDLFADEQLLDLYRELLGMKDTKPFDCVGTPDEVIVAFEMIRERGDFSESPVFRMYDTEVAAFRTDIAGLRKQVLAYRDDRLIPPTFKEFIQSV